LQDNAKGRLAAFHVTPSSSKDLMSVHPPSRQFQRRRRGAAVVELAICLPLLFTIIFGCIEACNMIFLKQALTAAAYEGALVAVRPGVDEAEVLQRIDDVLTARGISGSAVTIDGPGGVFANIKHGQRFTITIQAPTTENIPPPRLIAGLSNISASMTADKQ
jgi:Flp pilus assembly protein TadG